jgi:hypothetical protein
MSSLLASGCSVLDNLEFGGPPTLDPNRVYLDRATEITVPRGQDLDRYACVYGPLQCEMWGTSWSCNCRQ